MMTSDFSLLYLGAFIIISVVLVTVVVVLMKKHPKKAEPRDNVKVDDKSKQVDMDIKTCDEAKTGHCVNYVKSDYLYDKVLKDHEKINFAFDVMLQHNVEANKELAVSQVDWRSFTSREGVENKATQVVKDIFINPDMKKHMVTWRFSLLMFCFVLILVLCAIWCVFVLFGYPRQQQEFALKSVFTMCILVGLIFLLEWVSSKVVENVEEVGKLIH
jgi:Ca2+/Na+ antiporter